MQVGYDDLYEKGYIGVKEGRIIKIQVDKTTNSTEFYLNKIVGKLYVNGAHQQRNTSNGISISTT